VRGVVADEVERLLPAALGDDLDGLVGLERELRALAPLAGADAAAGTAPAPDSVEDA